MKKTKLGIILAAASMMVCVPACTGGSSETKAEFKFDVVLASGKSTIEYDSSKTEEENKAIFTDVVQVLEQNVYEKNGEKYFYVSEDGKLVKKEGAPVYTITVNKPELCVISTENLPAAEGSKIPVARTAGIADGNVIFTVVETTTRTRVRSSSIAVASEAELANGGYNFSNAADSKQQRQEILGKLEKYAVESHLTGITLFENGGYVKYNPRVVIPCNEYITGYGFGILNEGELSSNNINDTDAAKLGYYHSAYSQDPLTIAAMNASGSQVSDLAGYITSSFFGTKMNATKNGYEWYPVLAVDSVKGEAYNRPTPVDANGKGKYDTGFTADPLGIYNSWRIYVKTGSQYAYRATGAREAAFDGRAIALDDYVTPFKMLLTGANKLSRGAEMAADTSSGIKGAQSYYSRTKDYSSWEQVETAWATATTADEEGNRDLGISTGTDSIGDYIEIELINAIDDFTAMYTLSSNLYSPIPMDFLKACGGASEDVLVGIKNYGTFGNGGNILDYVINVGPFMLESWAENQAISFKRNDEWYEVKAGKRYKIPGVKLQYIDSSSDTEAVWKEFCAGKLDATGIPTKQLSAHANDEGVRQTKGDSTFKLNVNTCTQERWNELFGPEGKIVKNSTWTVKPWMSNDNFVNGLFHAINREEFAKKRGVQPSINYFSDAYLSDPVNGVSYNSTDEHEEAVKAFQTYKTVDGQEVSTYGYSQAEAKRCFQKAIAELEANGDIKAPQTLEIHIRWMYSTDIKEYGEDIERYFVEAFSAATSDYTLKVTQEAVTQWEDVYNKWMMVGQFDLGFGAISGNTYNPLNFLEVLKSDNSSGFTLNWGADTSKVDEKNPIMYKGEKWSFDALWAVADHGGVVEQGRIAKPIKDCYMENPKSISNPAKDEFAIYNGVTVEIPVKFTTGANTEFAVKTVKIYLLGIGYIDAKRNGFSVETRQEGDRTIVKVTITEALAAELNAELEKQVNGKKNKGDEGYIENPLIFANYYKYWEFTLFYTISIDGATPSLNTMTVYKTYEDNEAAKNN